MARMRSKRPLIIGAFIVVVLLAGTTVVAFLSHSGDHRTPELGTTELPQANDTVAPASDKLPLEAEQRLRQDLQAATTENGRVAVLAEFQNAPDARSTNQVLRSSMIADESPKVRSKAFQVAKALAAAESRDALVSILTEGVRNPYPEVRRESLRACQEHPSYEMMNELIEIVEQGGHERSIAVRALAFLDDPEAQRVVLETAQSETLTRAERVQAVALLSESELIDAQDYLQKLATGEDAELRAIAMEALRIIQERDRK